MNMQKKIKRFKKKIFPENNKFLVNFFSFFDNFYD